MVVLHPETEEEFYKILEENKKCFVDYFATWCGPCKQIAPFFLEMANNADYEDTVFVKVDTDKLRGVTMKQGVMSLPTFCWYFKGSRVGYYMGNSRAIETIQKKFSTSKDEEIAKNFSTYVLQKNILDKVMMFIPIILISIVLAIIALFYRNELIDFGTKIVSWALNKVADQMDAFGVPK